MKIFKPLLVEHGEDLDLAIKALGRMERLIADEELSLLKQTIKLLKDMQEYGRRFQPQRVAADMPTLPA